MVIRGQGSGFRDQGSRIKDQGSRTRSKEKMFDIDDFLTSTEIDVNATEIRFKDNRTGDVMTRTVYRPGKRVSFNTLAKELQTYGYTLLWVSDDPGDLPGRLNWSELFGYFMERSAA